MEQKRVVKAVDVPGDPLYMNVSCCGMMRKFNTRCRHGKLIDKTKVTPPPSLGEGGRWAGLD